MNILEQVEARYVGGIHTNAPRFHGNGFFQLYLDDSKETRFHVWSPDHKPDRPDAAQLHTHRFDMASEVLLGSLRHTVHVPVQRDYPGMIEELRRPVATHRVYDVVGASKTEGARLDEICLAHFKIEYDCLLTAGSKYTFGRNRFHTSFIGDPGKTTATVIRRTNFLDKGKWARVAIGIETDVASIRHAMDPEIQPSLHDMWDVIFDAAREAVEEGYA